MCIKNKHEESQPSFFSPWECGLGVNFAPFWLARGGEPSHVQVDTSGVTQCGSPGVVNGTVESTGRLVHTVHVGGKVLAIALGGGESES